jgi:hypothetical protein
MRQADEPALRGGLEEAIRGPRREPVPQDVLEVEGPGAASCVRFPLEGPASRRFIHRNSNGRDAPRRGGLWWLIAYCTF